MIEIRHHRSLVSIGSVLATLLYAVDTTVVNVALPHMQGTLEATQDQIAWVITAYIVASAISMPLAGWLGMRHGLRLVLCIAIAGFTVASVLCGVADGLEEMVLARAVQGTFGAALTPLSQVALLQEFPPEKHGKMMAFWTLGVMVGPILGPTLGGWLTDEMSWRWAFLINVPFGAMAALALWRGLPAHSAAKDSRPFDWLALLSGGLACLQLLLDRGHSLGWFSSQEIVTEALLAMMFFYMSIVHLRTSRHPFVDPAMFGDRNFAVALVLMFVLGLTIVSPTVLVPTFLQTIQGYPALAAGTVQASRGVGAMIAVLLAARLATWVSPGVLVGWGVLCGVASLLLFAEISVDTPRHFMVFAGLVNGLSMPFVFVPLAVTAYATLPRGQRAEAGAMLSLVRTMGSSIGVSISIAMLARSAQMNHSYLVENFTAYSAQRWSQLGFEPGPDAPTARLLEEITRQASAIAYANIFFLLAVVTLVVLPLAWLVRGAQARSALPPSVE
jgi:DHA2 family multidrug resistance protein